MHTVASVKLKFKVNTLHPRERTMASRHAANAFVQSNMPRRREGGRCPEDGRYSTVYGDEMVLAGKLPNQEESRKMQIALA